MINFLKWRFYRKVYLLMLTTIILLFSIPYSLFPISAQERTLTLDISVTNPSDEEVREVEVRADLPKELAKEDIISSDGLEVGYDAEKDNYYVRGSVTLQPAETTIYKIEVRDVWMVSENEINAVRSELDTLRFTQEMQDARDKAQEAAVRLDKILARQRGPEGDMRSHIAAYRENKNDFAAVCSVLGALRQESERTMQSARRRTQNAILIGILAVFFGVIAYVSRKKGASIYLRNKLRELGIGDRRRFMRLPIDTEVEYSLLPQREAGSRILSRNISQGGIAVFLDKPCPFHSVIELKIRLPLYAEMLKFRGFIVWQKRVAPRNKKEYYLTNICFGETEDEDYQKLKEFTWKRKDVLGRILNKIKK